MVAILDFNMAALPSVAIFEYISASIPDRVIKLVTIMTFSGPKNSFMVFLKSSDNNNNK